MLDESNSDITLADDNADESNHNDTAVDETESICHTANDNTGESNRRVTTADEAYNRHTSATNENEQQLKRIQMCKDVLYENTYRQWRICCSHLNSACLYSSFVTLTALFLGAIILLIMENLTFRNVFIGIAVAMLLSLLVLLGLRVTFTYKRNQLSSYLEVNVSEYKTIASSTLPQDNSDECKREKLIELVTIVTSSIQAVTAIVAVLIALRT